MFLVYFLLRSIEKGGHFIGVLVLLKQTREREREGKKEKLKEFVGSISIDSEKKKI